MRAFANLAGSVYDAALSPKLWPATLEAVANSYGFEGTAYFIRERGTGRIESLTFHGPLATATQEYLDYFVKLDPYLPQVTAAGVGRWQRLSRLLPESQRTHSEWYNDFIRRCGVEDVLATRIAATASRDIYLGLHCGKKDAPLGVRPAGLRQLLRLFGTAARLQIEVQELRRKAAAAADALEQSAAGLILACDDGHVIEMNRAAEHLIRRGDGLVVRHERIAALRSFESAKLAQLIAAAASAQGPRLGGQMLIARGENSFPYVVTVSPVSIGEGNADRPQAMILVRNLDEPSNAAQDLTELFGLSPAESCLVTALSKGKKLRDIASERHVSITTLRTQLSSALKKVHAERQSDLVRIVARL